MECTAHVGDVVFWPKGTMYRDANTPSLALEFNSIHFHLDDFPQAEPCVVRDMEGRIAQLAPWLNQT